MVFVECFKVGGDHFSGRANDNESNQLTVGENTAKNNDSLGKKTPQNK